MPQRQVKSEILIEASPKTIFEALIKPSMIKKWWLASSAIIIPEKGGVYAICWGDDVDDPDYITISRIIEFNPPSHLTLEYESYFSKLTPPPFNAKFEVQFSILVDAAYSKLSVIQSGFPNDSVANEYYEGCVQGWKDALKWIKYFLELN